MADLPTDDPLLGLTLRGRYRLDRVIGSGGAGAVYAATQLDLDRAVAIKVLRPELATDSVLLERFRREAKVSAGLNHPHIAQVLDFDGPRAPEPAFIALELLGGSSLLELLRKEPCVSPERAVRLILQVLSALETAHQVGIVHRDLKPGNLMVKALPGLPESVKLLDFGIAQIKSGDAYQKLTRTGMILGTPRYMAPEQITGGTVDARCDVWAVGVVLYRMLTGTVPFEGPPDRVIVAIVRDPVPPMKKELGVSPALEAVVRRALEKSAEQRFPSAAAMMGALATDGVLGPSAPRTSDRVLPTLESSAMRVTAPPVALDSNGLHAGGPPMPTASARTPAPTLEHPVYPSNMPGPPQSLAPAPSTPLVSSVTLGRVAIGLTVLLLGVAGLGVVGVAALALGRDAPAAVSADGRSPGVGFTSMTGPSGLPGGAPRSGDVDTYRAIALMLVRRHHGESITPLGFNLGGVVDGSGRIDFDSAPNTSISFLYQVPGGCVNLAIVPGAREDGNPTPCVGEPINSPIPPLQLVVAAAWSACPELAATERFTVISFHKLAGRLSVTVTGSTGARPFYSGSVENGAIVPNPYGACIR